MCGGLRSLLHLLSLLRVFLLQLLRLLRVPLFLLLPLPLRSILFRQLLIFLLLLLRYFLPLLLLLVVEFLLLLLILLVLLCVACIRSRHPFGWRKVTNVGRRIIITLGTRARRILPRLISATGGWRRVMSSCLSGLYNAATFELSGPWGRRDVRFAHVYRRALLRIRSGCLGLLGLSR